MRVDSQTVEKYLGRAIEEFHSNPLAVQLMRRLSVEGQEVFVSAALKYMLEPEQNNAHRMLGHLLLRQDSLLDQIANPESNTRAGAVDLFRRFHSLDSCFDVRLARKLPGRGSSWGGPGNFNSDKSARALDILDETSQGRRLLPILGHLPDSHDPRISSRATLFVGRRVRSADWTARQLGRSDPRIRANAVEALWGVTTPPAMGLFEECTADRHNRVAGNALVGLHIGGRQDAIQRIQDMSHDEQPDRRITAAWAMGRIANDNLAGRLTEMVRDENLEVRGMALRALMLIRKTSPLPAVAPEKSPEEIQPEVLSQERAAEAVKPQQDPVLAIDIRLDGRTFRAG